MVTTANNQLKLLKNTLDDIGDLANDFTFAAYMEIQSNIESALSKLEQNVDIPEPTEITETITLETSGEEIPLPISEEPDFRSVLRDPIEYPTDYRAFRESDKRAARRGTASQEQEVSGEFSRVRNKIWTNRDTIHRTDIGQLMRREGYNTPQSFINELQNNSVKYYAVLKGIEDRYLNYVPIIYCEGNNNNCHLVPIIKRSSGTKVYDSEPYKVSGTLEDVKDVARKRVYRKTLNDMFMVKGSMSAKEHLGMTDHIQDTRNERHRETTGIDDGIFVFRTKKRPPKYICSLEKRGESNE